MTLVSYIYAIGCNLRETRCACHTWSDHMPGKVCNASVYYDGSCPLCAAEIRYYRGLDCDNKLDFVDVSQTDVKLPDNLTRQQAMSRFHVMSGRDGLISGARAFAEIWANLPKWRWAARAAGVPGAMHVLEAGYSASLWVRPVISRLFGRMRSPKSADSRPDRQPSH